MCCLVSVACITTEQIGQAFSGTLELGFFSIQRATAIRTGQQGRQALEPLPSGPALASGLDRRSIPQQAPCRCPLSAGAGTAAWGSILSRRQPSSTEGCSMGPSSSPRTLSCCLDQGHQPALCLAHPAL